MTEQTLAQALEQEHHAIDAGIEKFRAAPENASDSLRQAIDGLRRHIYLEEAFLFPELRKQGLLMPVLVMLREHGELWRTLDELDRQRRDDPTSSTLAEICTDLLDRLSAHNMKEEPILYPHAESALGTKGSAELKEFMDSGSTPENWVCEQA